MLCLDVFFFIFCLVIILFFFWRVSLVFVCFGNMCKFLGIYF